MKAAFAVIHFLIGQWVLSCLKAINNISTEFQFHFFCFLLAVLCNINKKNLWRESALPLQQAYSYLVCLNDHMTHIWSWY